MQNRTSSLRRRVAIGLTVGFTALTIVISPAAAPTASFAQSGSQNDPSWDYGRGGSEVPGQPACYMPTPSAAMKKMYSLMRPACLPWKMQ